MRLDQKFSCETMDAVMIETAIREQMDCIVTRNLSDYAKSPIPVYTPNAFLALLLENEE